MHIIYVHGFNSTGTGSDKYLMLVDRFGKDHVSTLDLPYAPMQAIAALEDLIAEINKNDDNIILVGTSLGGFYATY
ncbi:YqiA/YcfP family alpha/beta fold hydrolase, partial [Paludibacterium sp.]|uniref:YqiA/YcfP family alpha/beta fold hydrolase n=1 Tax=Paludibacterium sp. TaxID=1917523 RepID=UPI0025D8F437